jgi:hypothetical protein
MPPLPTSVNYVDCDLNFVLGTPGDQTIVQALGITAPMVRPGFIRDSVAEDGAANQILTAGAGGVVLWADPAPTPGLTPVLTADPDAGGLTIVNLASLGLSGDALATPGCVLSCAAAEDILDFSTAADASGAAKSFSGSYLPIRVGGVAYFLPLFVV